MSRRPIEATGDRSVPDTSFTTRRPSYHYSGMLRPLPFPVRDWSGDDSEAWMRLQQCGLFQLFERGRRATCQLRGEMSPLEQHLAIGYQNRRNVRRLNLDLGSVEPIVPSLRLVGDSSQVGADGGGGMGMRPEPR